MHNTEKKDGNCLNGVSCAVTSCIYHAHDDACDAKHIKVASENAEMKMDTFCSTFAPKTSTY